MKIKNQILLVILVTCTVTGFSQLTVLNNYLMLNQKTDVYPVISNPNDGFPMLFISGKEIRVFYLTDECKFQKEILLRKPTKNSKRYLGSYIVDSNLIITFSNKKLTFVSQLIVNLRTDDYYERTNNLISENQKYLTSWEKDENLIVLGIVENTNKLIVSTFNGYGDASVNEYDFDDLYIDRIITNSSLYHLFNINEGKLQKIDYTIPVSLGITSARNKSYLINDEIIITIDLFDNVTYYLNINLSDNTYKIHSYNCNLSDSSNSASTKHNSFIYNNTIFQLSINKFEVGLKVQSLSDTNRVSSYHSSNVRNIDFTNSSMILRNEKEGFLYGNPEERNIKKARKFLRIISRMKPAISVFRRHTDFQILMGGVVETQQAKGVISEAIMVSGGEMIVGPGGNLIMPDPIYNFPSNYSFSSYSSRKAAYFSSVINATTYTHNYKSISKYTYDYIFDYANYMPGRFGLVTIFKLKGDYYLGYYSYSSHTYNIEWFKNIDDHVIRF